MKKVFAYLTTIQSIIASTLGFTTIIISDVGVPEKTACSAVLLAVQAVITFLAWLMQSEHKPKGIEYKCPTCEVTFYSEKFRNKCPACSSQMQKSNYGAFGEPSVENNCKGKPE